MNFENDIDNTERMNCVCLYVLVRVFGSHQHSTSDCVKQINGCICICLARLFHLLLFYYLFTIDVFELWSTDYRLQSTHMQMCVSLCVS